MFARSWHWIATAGMAVGLAGCGGVEDAPIDEFDPADNEGIELPREYFTDLSSSRSTRYQYTGGWPSTIEIGDAIHTREEAGGAGTDQVCVVAARTDEYGNALEDANGNLLTEAIQPRDPSEVQGWIPTAIDFHGRMTDEEYDEIRRLNTRAHYRKAAVEGSAEYNSHEELSRSTRTLRYAYYFTFEFPADTITSPLIAPAPYQYRQIERTRRRDRVRRMENLCGNQYVSEVTYGGSAYYIFELEFESSHHLDRWRAAFNFETDGSAFRAGLNSAMSNFEERHNTSVTLSVRAGSVGLDSLPGDVRIDGGGGRAEGQDPMGRNEGDAGQIAAQNVQDILSGFEEWRTSIQNDVERQQRIYALGNVIGFVTGSYMSIGFDELFNDNPFSAESATDESLLHYMEELDKYRTLERRLQYAIDVNGPRGDEAFLDAAKATQRLADAQTMADGVSYIAEQCLLGHWPNGNCPNISTIAANAIDNWAGETAFLAAKGRFSEFSIASLIDDDIIQFNVGTIAPDRSPRAHPDIHCTSPDASASIRRVGLGWAVINADIYAPGIIRSIQVSEVEPPTDNDRRFALRDLEYPDDIYRSGADLDAYELDPNTNGSIQVWMPQVSRLTPPFPEGRQCESNAHQPTAVLLNEFVNDPDERWAITKIVFVDNSELGGWEYNPRGVRTNTTPQTGTGERND
ncbi:MAG: hypothetical protein QUV02_02365 [Maricaulis sp.]|uniref:hypothetical protein n=1 Tax=Maricaulis sp. TaxID=1486257 RepID=UPI002635EDDD|nr:hypothetical protein [Maricaulis sp.]MDM7983266.1 hypothetical protein [Maricaulis sp.]